MSLEAAKVFASSDILLLGNEPQTIGPQDTPMAVHLTLLGANVVLCVISNGCSSNSFEKCV